MLDALILTLSHAAEASISAFPNALSSPSSRLFWPLLITPLLFIIVVTGLRFGKAAGIQQCQAFLNPKQFFTRDSLIDIALLLFNAGAKIAVVIPLLGGKLAVAMAVSLFLQQQVGDGIFAGHTFNGMLVISVFSLAFFIAEDASRFGLHYTMHKVPLLWKLHQVHHSAHTLTPLTLHRVHPLEMALYYLRSILVFGLMAGSFTWALQSPATVWAFLGVDALGFIFNACAANLRHSGVYLSFGWLERFFISPAQHQIHHSSALEHHDKNFGTCLSLWDKLAKSWVASEKQAENPLQFGIYK